MAHLDVAGLVRELERLGVALTAVRLADGKFRVNRWRMLSAVANTARIDSLWAEAVGDDPERLDRIATHLLAKTQSSLPADTRVPAPVPDKTAAGVSATASAPRAPAPLPQAASRAVPMTLEVASDPPELASRRLAPSPSRPAFAPQKLAVPPKPMASPKKGAPMQKAVAPPYRATGQKPGPLLPKVPPTLAARPLGIAQAAGPKAAAVSPATAPKPAVLLNSAAPLGKNTAGPLGANAAKGGLRDGLAGRPPPRPS